MRIAGFLLLVAGWGIALSAVVLLGSLGQRTAFAMSGIGVEVLGGVLAFRSHRSSHEGRK